MPLEWLRASGRVLEVETQTLDADLLAKRVARDTGVDLAGAHVLMSAHAFTEAVSRAWLGGATMALNRMAGHRTCRICGCWELAACEGGCAWVEDDLCTACTPRTVC